MNRRSRESQCGEAKVARLLEDVEQILVNIVSKRLVQNLAAPGNTGLPWPDTCAASGPPYAGCSTIEVLAALAER